MSRVSLLKITGSLKTVKTRSFSTQRIPAIGPWPKVNPSISKGNVYNSFLDAVGNTALIRLNGPSQITGCNIYGKCEFQNPGGSVKDRAALFIVKDAEERGILVPGQPGLIIEGTAGNTGIGLTMVGNARGYNTIIVIAETQSKEKKDTLRYGGATLLEVPAVPFKNQNNYVHVAQRLAEALKNSNIPLYQQRILYADQWSNPANRRAHIETTGPEIWAQTDGAVNAFSCATGTGGTLTGVAQFLKSKNPNIKIALTDPCGAGLVNLYHHGELKANGDSISEGIGQNRVTGNMKGFESLVDYAFEIPDQTAMPVMYDLLKNEGLSVGSSTAINVAGAMRLAQELPKGSTVVTILCDVGTRYASRIYNPTFLRSRNLNVPSWLDEETLKNDQQTNFLKEQLAIAMKLK